VDTVLAYPVARGFDARAHVGVADVAAGRKSVRLVLAGLPFGFHGPDERQAALDGWSAVLNAG
jgi:hypothetical protein